MNIYVAGMLVGFWYGFCSVAFADVKAPISRAFFWGFVAAIIWPVAIGAALATVHNKSAEE